MAIGAAVATGLLILLGGALSTVLVTSAERAALDDRLAEQSAKLQEPLSDALQYGTAINTMDLAAQRPDVGTFIRLYTGNRLLVVIGSPDLTFPTPRSAGYDTVRVGNRSWRTHVAKLQSADGTTLLLETGTPTIVTDELVHNLRARTAEVASVSAVFAGFAGLLIGNAATRPLKRLRIAAETVSQSQDLSVRVPKAGNTQEIDDLADSFNVMLERLQEASASTIAALASSRAFAGNAAHEMRTPLTSMQANLDVLANPNLEPDQRREVVEAIKQEQTRLVRLLDALHTLARGDVVGAAQREEMDLADVVGVAVDGARRRYPDLTFHYDVPAANTELFGWPDGLPVMVDNLLNNAARHGGRNINVIVDRQDEHLYLIVDDDGPGIPEDERSAVFTHFFRGRNTKVAGSGLGLALVAQQARLHNGNVHVEESSAGGARFVVDLVVPVTSPPDMPI